MTKKLILATIAGSVVQFLLGWLVYGLILADFMNSHTIHYEGMAKDMESGSFIILIFISGLFMSFMISYIFQRWAKFSHFMQGLNGGMFLGFFMSGTYDLATYAMMNVITVNSMIVDVIAATIVAGIVGGVIAWVLGMGSKAAPAK